MNIYLFKRQDNVDYDEYDSFVVVAENEAEALDLIIQYVCDSDFYRHRPYKVEIVGFAKDNIDSGVILGSFNAG